MARIRYLKPEFFKDEDLAVLPFETRLFFAGLWGLADKAGRLEDRPIRLKAEIFPYDSVDAEKCLEQLSKPKNGSGKPFINRYITDNQRYIEIINWEKHQKPHHTEKNSVIPSPPPIGPKRRKEAKEEINLNLKGMEKGMEKQLEASAPLSNGDITVKPLLITTTSSEEIIEAWRKLPLPHDFTEGNEAAFMAIERQLSVLAKDINEPVHHGSVIEAIQNYGKALSLPDTQAHLHKLYPFLQKHVRSYVSYNFNIENYKKSNFEKEKNKESVQDQFKRLGLK